MTREHRRRPKKKSNPVSKPAKPDRAPALPRSREALALLLQRVAALLEYLNKAHHSQRERLKILQRAVANRYSVLDGRTFLNELSAESTKNAAAGGPELSALLDYVDWQQFRTALDRFKQAIAGLRGSIPKSWSPHAVQASAEADERLVDAQTELMETFRNLQQRILSALERSADKSDKSADKSPAQPIRLPRNPDVIDLAKRLNDKAPAGRSQMEIAVEFTDGDEELAASLLRQVRRYPNLRLK
jgi:hypothetical protein